MDGRLMVGTTWSCPDLTLVGALETLERAGFAEAEVWADGMHLDPRVGPDVADVEDWLRAHPLTVRSVHLPFDAVLPGAPADERSAAWADLCGRTLDLGHRLGAELAVAHPVLFGDDGDDHDRMVGRFVPALRAIADRARARGIRLTLENMHTLRGPTLRSVRDLRSALARVARPVGVCLDVGHAVFNGHLGDGLRAEIEAAGDLLAHTHLHDSDGAGRDPHLVPGDGVVDWPAAVAAFRRIGYPGRHVLEVRGGDDPLATLREARARLLATGP
ncbi:sugar phosphate isomerase/epimerase family protein [Actinomadura kijaniata]|uniref:sugar phosphate isomerase/epimerase family protein n=1 Tax=Actinomadura kijaniata TaxID=46161 RepID=UPI003F1AD548